MLGFFVIFIFSMIFSSIFPIFAKRVGLIDTPNNRSIHITPTPRGGGIIFIPSILIGFILFQSNSAIFTNIPILISIFLIWLTGLIDDIKGISPKIKFLSIAVAVTIVYMQGIAIYSVHNFASTTIYLGILTLPFTYFAVAGFTNAFNLIDGMDLLATSIAILIVTFFILLGYKYGDEILLFASLYLLASLLAFSIYNRPPAKIFMGDSGSLSLGFVLSILFIESIKYIDAVTVLYIGALPVTDTLVSMLRRSRDGHSLVSADRCHLHHILLKITKGSIYKTLSILTLYQISMMVVGYLSTSHIDSAYMLILYLLHTLLIYRLVIYLRDRYRVECYPDIDS